MLQQAILWGGRVRRVTMVRVLRKSDCTELRLTPNRSLSWRGNMRILYSLCAISVVIVGGMMLAGAWVVLPFVGLELGALALALYLTAWRCRQQEVLSLQGDNLVLEKGVYRRQARWEWPRRFTRVTLEIPRHPWTPPVLYLSHRDERVVLAPFLNGADAIKLVKTLEGLGFPVERRPSGAP